MTKRSCGISPGTKFAPFLTPAASLTTRLGISGPCDAAPLLRRSTARLRTGGTPVWKTLSLQRTPSIRVLGKNQKERCPSRFGKKLRPISAPGSVGSVPAPELFGCEGAAMTRARLRVHPRQTRLHRTEKLLVLARTVPVSPHQLRHSCALVMLQATRDIRKVGFVARPCRYSARPRSPLRRYEAKEKSEEHSVSGCQLAYPRPR